jgi:hypothetical protein
MQRRGITVAAAILVLGCPLVYAVTDLLPVPFEKFRDGYFLATAVLVILVSAIWLAYSVRLRDWRVMFGATAGLLTGLMAVCVILWMFMYFE